MFIIISTAHLTYFLLIFQEITNSFNSNAMYFDDYCGLLVKFPEFSADDEKFFYWLLEVEMIGKIFKTSKYN